MNGVLIEFIPYQRSRPEAQRNMLEAAQRVGRTIARPKRKLAGNRLMIEETLIIESSSHPPTGGRTSLQPG